MTLLQSIFLGIIQGLTEFIPVSSTAHLLIGQRLLGLPANDAMFSFLVIVQLGTLVSLFAFYWNDLLSILKATLNLREPTPQRDLGLFIVVATIPALVAGFLLKDAVEALFEQPMLQASIRLFAAAILLTLAEALTRKDRTLVSMTGWDALLIGVMQVISVFPGASRSGTTISGGMFRGFDRPSAARFAFLMSVPVLLAAGGYEMLDVVQMPDLGQFLPVLAVGFITAAIVGWFAIKWLIAYLSKHSLYVFAAYCAVLGAIVFFLR
jgi:undecaprenyl-diphosphatase